VHQWSVLQVQIKQQLSERLNMIRNVRDELQPCKPLFDRSIGSDEWRRNVFRCWARIKALDWLF